MNLAEFMAAEKIDDATLGARVNKSRSRISLYRRGLEPIPSEVVIKLVELSHGKMTANELLGISEAAE